MNINLHIERLILDGIAMQPGQHYLLQASVQTELTRLLGEGGLAGHFLMAGGTQARILSPSIRLDSGLASADLGQQIAGAVYAGIGK